MQRVGFVLKVRQELLEEYKGTHQNVWPEMQQALREAGWTNYSLFAREDGTLFGYLETEDFEHSLFVCERCRQPVFDVASRPYGVCRIHTSGVETKQW